MKSHGQNAKLQSNEADIDLVERHLLRIGIENIGGFLRQGMRGWFEAGLPFEHRYEMSVHELNVRLARGSEGLQVLDVRRDDEWSEGAIPTAKHVFAPYLTEHLDIVEQNKPVAVYCGSGYRASIASSVLQRNGFSEVYNIPGSMAAWKAARYDITKPQGEA